MRYIRSAVQVHTVSKVDSKMHVTSISESMIRCNALKCISRFNENYSKYVYYNTNYSSRFTVTVQIHQGYISLAKSKNGLLREITRILFCQRNKESEKRLIADSFLRKKRKIQKRIFSNPFPKKRKSDES